MNKKRACALVVMMLFLFSSVSAFATEDRITFGNIGAVTENGLTTVTAELKTKPAGKSLTLIAAYIHPDTGRLLKINAESVADVSQLAENSVSVSVEDKSSDGGTLKYFAWDSLSGGMSLLNASPEKPNNLEATLSMPKADLSWEAPLDDYDDTSALTYSVYDDGLLLANSLTSVSHQADKLAWGSEYHFGVCATDTEGAESEAAETIVKTPYQNTVETTSSVSSSPDGNLQFTGSIDEEKSRMYYYCKKDVAGGLDCYATALRSQDSSGTYLMYKFGDSYFSELAGATGFVCEMTYFDEGTDKVTVDWWCSNKQVYDRLFFTKTNTSTWKTVRQTYSLDGGVFAYNDNEGNAYYNFRFKPADKNSGLKVRRLSVFPIYGNETKDAAYNTVQNNAGAYLTADKTTISCYLSSGLEGQKTAEVSGRRGVLTNDGSFSVSDKSLQSGNVKVYVSVYAPDENTTLTLGTQSQTVAETEKWQKLCFELANIGSGQQTLASNKNVYIHEIRVVSAD